jgi:hypothetical protein
MSLQHLGIPISEEQCIGDSLSILNTTFQDLDTRIIDISAAAVLSASNIVVEINNLKQADIDITTNLNLSSNYLSTNLSLTSNELVLSATNLQTYINALSGRYTYINQDFVILTKDHFNTTLILTAANNTNISIKSGETFNLNHKTTILQLGTGYGVFSNEFLTTKSQTLQTQGQYTSCLLQKIDNNSDWVITGQLSAAPRPLPNPPEIFQFLLSGPLDVNLNEAIEIAGVAGDVLYFNSRPLAESTNETMSVKVNGVKRMTVAFTSDRVGTHFGYKASGSNTIVWSFFNKNEVELTINDNNITTIPSTVSNTDPIPIQFEYQLTGDRKDLVNEVEMFTSGKADVLYYNTAPLDSEHKIVVSVFVNNSWRSTITTDANRLGSSFGYKIAGTSDVLYGVFTIDSPYSGSYSKVLLTHPTWTPPSIPPVVEFANSIVGPQNTNQTNSIKITTFGFPDNILVENRTTTTVTILSTMVVNVNGNDRMAVEFTADRTNTSFQYKMSGYPNSLLTGRFGAGKVYLGSGVLPLTITSLYNPFSAKLFAGNYDSLNELDFNTNISNSVIYYDETAPINGTSTASLFASGDTVSFGDIVFNNSLLGQSFGISLETENPKTQAPFMFGVFQGGSIELGFALTGNQTDPYNKISMLNHTNSAKLFYKKRPSTNSTAGTTSHLFIGGEYIASITYLLDYQNQPFKFTPFAGGSVYSSTFVTGRITLA